MKKSKRTVARVNKELKRRGHEERLARGPGYSYFRNGRAHEWKATAVYVSHPDQLSVEQWLAERDRLEKGEA